MRMWESIASSSYLQHASCLLRLSVCTLLATEGCAFIEANLGVVLVECAVRVTCLQRRHTRQQHTHNTPHRTSRMCSGPGHRDFYGQDDGGCDELIVNCATVCTLCEWYCNDISSAQTSRFSSEVSRATASMRIWFRWYGTQSSMLQYVTDFALMKQCRTENDMGLNIKLHQQKCTDVKQMLGQSMFKNVHTLRWIFCY